MKRNQLERAVLTRFLKNHGVGAELDLGSVELVSGELTTATHVTGNSALRSDALTGTGGIP